VAPFSNKYDSVIVYQSNNSPLYPALSTANRQVKVTIPNLGAEVLNNLIGREPVRRQNAPYRPPETVITVPVT
jgi:hypothetical protein